MNRTDRLLAIMLELQTKKWQRAEDLAETFEVSKRTIYRDMLALTESGVPVISSPGQGYALVEGYFLPPLSFSGEEAIVLLLGLDYMTQSFDVQYQSASISAGKKIRAVLNEKLRNEVADMQKSMRFISMNPLTDGDGLKPEILAQLRRAIIQRKQVRMDYHTRQGENSGQNRRDVDPYALVHVGRAWYLVAYCHLRRDTRRFRLDRIDDLQVLTASFQRPEDFVIMRSTEEEDRNVVVRVLFSTSVARWVREDQSFYMVNMEEHSNGLLVTFQVRQESDLVQWLLGWGGQARVLEPLSLQQRLSHEAEAILRVYQSSESLLT